MGSESRRRSGGAGSALLRHRVGLPAVLALLAACFLLGRLSSHRAQPVRTSTLPDPAVLAAFADAAHQGAMKEAHLVRRQAAEGVNASSEALAAPSGEGESVQEGAQEPAAVLRQPLPAGASGNSFVSYIPFQVLSWEPRAVFFPGFADVERCVRLREMAAKRLAPSGLALRQGDTPASTGDIRTSQGTFLSRREDSSGVLDWLEKRIADVTMLPQSHGEPFNVLRYEAGQKYDSHYDTFDPESYGPQSSQRTASFLLYLSEWEAGGETVFPLEGPGGLQRLRNIDYKSCAQGLLVKPLRTGDALLFYSTTPDAAFDKHALHGGCPVANGTKWVATKWIRDKSFGN